MGESLKFAVIGDVRLSGPSNAKALDGVCPELRRLGAEAVVVCSAGTAVRLVPLRDDMPLSASVAAAFAADAPPVEKVRFRGCDFVLCNTGELSEAGAASITDGTLRKDRPFFYFQSRHPRGTCAGDFVAGQDKGVSTRALSGFPLAVAFSVGAKAPLTDERSIRQGDFGFTAVQTSSFHTPQPFGGRENALPFGRTPADYADDRQMRPVTEGAPKYRPAVLVTVDGNVCTLSRRSLSLGRPLGGDWTLRPGEYGAFDYARRAAESPVPAFAPGARLEFRPGRGRTMKGVETDQLTVRFPKAPGARAHEYLVTVRFPEAGIDVLVAERRVYPAGALGPAEDEPESVRCVFAKRELFQDATLVFEVRALNAFGASSGPLCGSFRVASNRRWRG